MMAAAAKRRQVKKTRNKTAPSKEFKELASSLKGSMSWLDITVDQYLTAKHAAVDAENAAWEKMRETR